MTEYMSAPSRLLVIMVVRKSAPAPADVAGRVDVRLRRAELGGRVHGALAGSVTTVPRR